MTPEQLLWKFKRDMLPLLPPAPPHQQAHRHVYKDPGFLALKPRGSRSDRGCEPEGTPETAPSLGVSTPVLVGAGVVSYNPLGSGRLLLGLATRAPPGVA